jgi:hypothetical protein
MPTAHLTRRQFLAGSASLVAAELLAADSKVPIIDTHLHCFAGTGDRRFPYHTMGPPAALRRNCSVSKSVEAAAAVEIGLVHTGQMDRRRVALACELLLEIRGTMPKISTKLLSNSWGCGAGECRRLLG